MAWRTSARARSHQKTPCRHAARCPVAVTIAAARPARCRLRAVVRGRHPHYRWRTACTRF